MEGCRSPYTSYNTGKGSTHIDQRPALPENGDSGPDGNLDAAQGAQTYAQRLAPARVLIMAVVQRSVVHFHEDVEEDELRERKSVLEIKSLHSDPTMAKDAHRAGGGRGQRGRLLGQIKE